MGNSSSQMAASQAQTQDMSVSLQPFTQISALDGTQEQPQTLKRAASSMDETAMDTVKKTKRAWTQDARRSGKRSIPQHTLGYSIQPSQEVPETQEEAQASAGAVDDLIAQRNHPDQGIVVTRPDDVQDSGRSKSKKAERRRLPWQREHEVPKALDTIEGLKDEAGTHDETVDEIVVSAASQKKRKRKDIELEKLREDVQSFAPEHQSTPKQEPQFKRSKRLKDAEKPKTIHEQPEVDNVIVPTSTVPQKGSKRARGKKEDVTSKNNTKKRKPAVVPPSKKQSRISNKAENAGATNDTVSQALVGWRRDASLDQELPPSASAEDKDQATEGADATGPTADPEEDPPVDSIPTPPESPDAPEADLALADQGLDEATVSDARHEHDFHAVNLSDIREAPQPQQVSVRDIADTHSTKKKTRATKKPAADAAVDLEGVRENEKGRPNAGIEKSTLPTVDRVSGANRKSGDDQIDEDKQSDEFEDEGSETGTDQEYESSGAESKRKAKRSNKTSTVSNAVNVKRGQIKGMWSDEERARADEIFNDVVRVTAVPDWELKANIIDWKNPTPHLRQFKEAMHEAFPARSLKSISRFCQRRYNAFERGDWTAEQDQRLREAYQLFPDQWTAISDSVGRFWEDCRGRWRDVLSREKDKAELGPWSREEELRLAKAVKECRDIVMKEAEDEDVRNNEEKADALVSWKVVAEKMGSTRSAKRCREKWKRIKSLDLAADAGPSTTQPIKTGKKPSTRTLEAERDYQQCDIGDVYDMLCEICSAIPDVDRVFEHETTMWSVVAVKNAESRFTSALRRKALSAAVDDYPCKAVWEAETQAAKAKGAKGRMELMERKGKIELNRTFIGKPQKAKKADTAQASGKENEAPDSETHKKPAKKVKPASEKPKTRKKQLSASKPRESKQYKSADRVVESDDDNADEIEVTKSSARKPTRGSDEGEVEVDGTPPAVREQTAELRSVGSEPPEMSPSTFVNVLKGGKRKRDRKKGKGGQGKTDVKAGSGTFEMNAKDHG